MANVKYIYKGIALEPQSSDPSGPVEGQIQYADGTARNKGLWQYKDGDWKAIGGGGVGSFSIFETFDADVDSFNDWTESAGTWTEDTSTELSGAKSYKWTPNALNDTLDSPSVTLPKRTLDLAGRSPCKVEFAYDASNDGFQAIILDNSSNVLATLDLDSTKYRAQIFFNLTGSETSLKLRIKDVTHTASMNIVFDDITFDDEPFRKIETIQVNSINLTGNDGRAITANTEDLFWSGSGTGWTGGADNASSYYSVQANNSVVNIAMSLFFTTTAPRYVNLYKNGTLYKTIGDISDTTDLLSASYTSAKGEFNAGDQLSFRLNTTSTLSNSSTFHHLTINETFANESVLVADADGSELTAFTPVFTNMGTVTNASGFYVRQGDRMVGFATCTTGTVGSAPFSMDIPSSLTLNTSKITINNTTSAAGMKVGSAAQNGGASRSFHVVTAPATSTSKIYLGGNDAGTSHLTPSGGSIGSSEVIAFHFDIPIQGWSATQAHIMDIADPYENVYSCRIDKGSGTATKTSESKSGAFTVSHSATGISIVNYSSLGLTVAPSISVALLQNTNDTRTIWIQTISTTQAVIATGNGDGNTLGDYDYELILQRQGADYREPKGYFIGQSVPMRTAYIKEIQSVNTASTTSLSSATYVKNVLNTVSGDSSFISLSSSAFTLGAGTYDIEATIPCYVNSSSNTVGTFKARLRNTSDSSTVASSAAISTRGSGTTAGHMAGQNLEIKERVTLTASKTFEIQTWVNTTTNTAAAIGAVANATESEVYTQVKIVKVK